MKKIQFIFDGGLGNQLFQFFASKYISYKFKDLKLSYALSKSILNGRRNFELLKLIKEPIKISEEFRQFDDKIYGLISNNIPFLRKVDKNQLKYKLDLLNGLYNEKELESFKNPLLKLSEDLNLLKNDFSKLKVLGFWQNPNCYIKNLNIYRNLLIDTNQILPEGIFPNRYISIHIRRGDYLSNKEYNNYLFHFSPIKFILLSLQLIPEEFNDLPIYLISDDKHWAENFISFLPENLKNRFYICKTKDHFEDWAILRHSRINICSNSTFSYTAALCNYENLEQKLRCIIPQWFQKNVSAFEKGWLCPKGFIEI